MSIIRISNFEARAGQGDALHAFLLSVKPLIEEAPGCQGCRLLRNQDKETGFVVIEFWASVEAHQASVRNIPKDKLAAVMPMLAGLPSAAYYAE